MHAAEINRSSSFETCTSNEPSFFQTIQVGTGIRATVEGNYVVSVWHSCF